MFVDGLREMGEGALRGVLKTGPLFFQNVRVRRLGLEGLIHFFQNGPGLFAAEIEEIIFQFMDSILEFFFCAGCEIRGAQSRRKR